MSSSTRRRIRNFRASFHRFRRSLRDPRTGRINPRSLKSPYPVDASALGALKRPLRKRVGVGRTVGRTGQNGVSFRIENFAVVGREAECTSEHVILGFRTRGGWDLSCGMTLQGSSRRKEAPFKDPQSEPPYVGCYAIGGSRAGRGPAFIAPPGAFKGPPVPPPGSWTLNVERWMLDVLPVLLIRMPLAESSPIATAPPSELLGCHDCDALFECRPLEEGETVICPRCRATLHACRKNSVHRATAFAISAAVLFIVANLYPFLTLEVSGQLSEITLTESVSELNAHGSPWLAAGVAIFIIGSPSLMLTGMLYLLLPLLSGHRLPGALAICRWVYSTDPWNMIEVFLIGVLVSLLKLGDIAKVTLGTSFWAFAGTIICLTAAVGAIDRRELWDRLEVAGR